MWTMEVCTANFLHQDGQNWTRVTLQDPKCMPFCLDILDLRCLYITHLYNNTVSTTNVWNHFKFHKPSIPSCISISRYILQVQWRHHLWTTVRAKPPEVTDSASSLAGISAKCFPQWGQHLAIAIGTCLADILYQKQGEPLIATGSTIWWVNRWNPSSSNPVWNVSPFWAFWGHNIHRHYIQEQTTSKTNGEASLQNSKYL